MTDVERDKFSSRRDALRDEIRGMAGEIERLFRLAMEGLGCFRAGDLRQVIDKVKAVESETDRLTASLFTLSEGRSDADASDIRLCIGVVSELKLISGCIEDFCESAAARIKEGLLFSDAAFKEIEDLHVAVASILRDAVQAMGEGKRGSLPQVEEKGRAVEAVIKKIGAEHERRLMSGVCDIKSSAVFLDILDSLGGIADHAVALSRTCSAAR
jgi:phosphate:Na+ symporter